MADETERVSIPLMMYEGNLECLLENSIPCNSISLMHYGAAGVVIVFHQSDEQKKEAKRLGMKSQTVMELMEDG